MGNLVFNLFLHNGSYLLGDINQIFKGAFFELVGNYQKVYKSTPKLRFLNLLTRNRLMVVLFVSKKISK